MKDRERQGQPTFHDSRGPREVDVPYLVRAGAAWTWRLGVIGLGILALLWLVAFFQVIVVPVLVAVLLTALLSPLVNGMHRRGVPRGLAVALALLGGMALLVGLLVLVGTQFASGLPDLVNQAAAGFDQVRQWLVDGPLGLSDAQLQSWVDRATAQVSGNNEQLVAGALSFTSTAGHVIAGLFLVLFATIFFLYDGRRIWRWTLRLLPASARGPMDGAGQRGWLTLTSYVKATIAVAFVDAVGIGAGAAVLQVPLAVPLAVLVFLGAFVPIVGAFVSGSVAVLVALVAQGPVVALLMLAVVLGVQQLESHVLQPFLLGRAVAVHPLAVILAIAAGVLVAGIVGALFAVPLVAVVNTMLNHLAGSGVDVEDIEAPVARE